MRNTEMRHEGYGPRATHEVRVEAGGLDETTQALLAAGGELGRVWWARRESRRLMVAGEPTLRVVEDVLRRAGVDFETTRREYAHV